MSGVDERVERVREALAHPHYVEPLPGNDVIEVRMPKRIYDEALAALDSIVGALPACGVQGVGYKIGCGEQIASIGELYRCATCAVPFHEDCLRAHFNHRDDFVPSPSNVERVVMAEAAVASLEQRADALGFYANPDNWTHVPTDRGAEVPAFEDRGCVARAALGIAHE